MNVPRIAIIHATPLAIEPISEAFSRLWPEADCMNLLDDKLSPDLVRAGSVDAELVERMVQLARYAQQYGASGILYSCSAFGVAVDEAKRVVGLPTLKPNEAMFDEAIDFCERTGRGTRIGLLTTFAPASVSMLDELKGAICERGLSIDVEGVYVPGALDALNAGDFELHDSLVFEAAKSMGLCSVLLLGQFSMARAQEALSKALKKPVLTSPSSAVRKLHNAIKNF